MKKNVLSVALVTLTSLFSYVNAQPRLTSFGLFEDFSTKQELESDSVLHRGLFWWKETNVDSIKRDAVNKRMIISVSQLKWGYIPFGISFGDSNGSALGGDPYTVDLSGNGKFSFDIENTGKDSLSVRVSCQDIQNRLVDCSPGAAVFGDIWKYQTQMLILPGQKVTFKAGTENLAGAGMKNTCDFANDIWGDYGTHTIRYDCDIKHIKGINITVLNGAKDPVDLHSKPLNHGTLAISNFIVGDTSVTATTSPTPTLTMVNDSVIVADTTGSTVKAYFNTTGTWTAKSSVAWLVPQMYTSNSGKDSVIITAFSNPTMSSRSATIILSAKYAESQIVTVTQEPGKIEASVSSVTLKKYDGSSVSVDVKSEASWTAISNVNWLSVKDSSGVLVLSATANQGVARTGKITITSPGASPLIIVVTQESVKTDIEINKLENKTYRIIGNTVFFDDKESCIYTILGTEISVKGETSVTLQSGMYIIKTPTGNDKVVIISK